MTQGYPRSIEITPSILYFGTPVALISTIGANDKDNITPMSSVWALGDRLALGLATASQGCQNLLLKPEAVVNLPGPDLHAAVERLAPTTGRSPVPHHKVAMGYRTEEDKFTLARFTPISSLEVLPPRIGECPIQIEVRVLAAHAATTVDDDDPGLMLFEAQALRVHAHEEIVVPGTNYIRTEAWSPLLYVFRHYFGTGQRLGRNFRAET
jgi:flavin reductase (DIM6/NTAB) family NADH-FMN oxidoreductase RutF